MSTKKIFVVLELTRRCCLKYVSLAKGLPNLNIERKKGEKITLITIILLIWYLSYHNLINKKSFM